MHVAEVVRKYETKAGPSESRSYLLRRSFREDGKVRHETLANLSALPPQAVAALREVLAGKTLVVADEGFELLRARPHGHVAAVAAQAKALGFPELLGPAVQRARHRLRARALACGQAETQARHALVVEGHDPL